MHGRMKRSRAMPPSPRTGESAFALPFALMMVFLVLLLGLVFLQLGAMDALNAGEDVEGLQAVTAAEFGLARARAMALSQNSPWYTMKYNGTFLSTSPGWGYSSNTVYQGHQVCNFFTNLSVPSSPATYSVVIEDLTGYLPTSGTYRIHGWGACGPYKRHVTWDCQTLTYASFLWLTNSENTVYFRTGDKLNGPTYTNDTLNIWGSPTFVQHVFTAAASLHYGQGGPPTDNPNFQQGVTYNAPKLNIPALMNSGNITAIMNAAQQTGGILLPSNSGRPYVITFGPTAGYMTIKKTNSDGSLTAVYSNKAISSTNGAIYSPEAIQVSGVVGGQITIGTSQGHDIQITNNLTYSYPSNPATMFQSGFNQSNPLLVDKLALVSGGNVVLDETWTGSWTDMYIAGSFASVTGSFENNYYTLTPVRNLHVYGGIAQMTRGAVGTVGSPGTGFLKDYLYDARFTTSPPPHLPPIGAEFTNWTLDPANPP